MSAIPVIAIFDAGKTNKKLLLFDEGYKIVFEKSAVLEETVDEGGYPCENLERLEQFIFDSLNEVMALPKFQVKAVNVSAYGASIVYIGKDAMDVLTPNPQRLGELNVNSHQEDELNDHIHVYNR